MPTIASRIAKLEEVAGSGRGRIIAVRSKDATSREIDAFLDAQRLDYDPRRDMVVHLAFVSAPADWHQIELMNVTEMRR